MTFTDEIELTRLAVQKRLDSAKTRSDRNRLGQFATPPTLAAEMLLYAKRRFMENARIRFLDPAFGIGAFYSALLRAFPESHIQSAIGYETDQEFGYEALQLWGETPLQLRLEDFTRAEPPRTVNEKATLLICNPPYVRHHHLLGEEKERLQSLTQRLIGIAPSGLAGLYIYFVLLSHNWLAPDGLSGWLIPTEFMEVNYGRALKQYLLERVTLLNVHRFRAEDVQFEDALVSSAVVWFRNAPPPPQHAIEFSYGGTLTHPTSTKHILLRELKSADKWSRLFGEKRHESVALDGSRLSDLFTIKRGIATGANGFFILDEKQVEENKIPRETLIPILPSPRYVVDEEIHSDASGYPDLERRLFLLNCTLPESAVKTRYPTLWKYLEAGKAKKVHERYLCRHRTPWYAQEEREPAALLCTYMGRSHTLKGKPFRFILNRSQAVAANVYLMLYPKQPLQSLLKTNPELLRSIWMLLNEISVEELVTEGRTYGGGLHKLEPSELGNLSAERITSIIKCHPLQLSLV